MNSHPPDITEDQLVAALQPIRNFYLAQALFHFMHSGVHGEIQQSGSITIDLLADRMGLNHERLGGLLDYLHAEGFVDIGAQGETSLTSAGKEIAYFRPWYTLLVGGYAETLLQLSATLRADAPFATRNLMNVGIGSGGISQYDALPMARLLLGRLAHPTVIVDLGCGDGSFLLSLCQTLPEARGIGLDLAEASVEVARRAAQSLHMDDRVAIHVGNVATLPDFDADASLCFVAAFVLQEVLRQSGEEGVLEVLGSVFERYPDAHVIVIEVDHRPRDAHVISHPLGLSYYNPYYLIHQLTEQRLETSRYWVDLFERAGGKVIATEFPKSSYDSLALKVGFLIGCRSD